MRTARQVEDPRSEDAGHRVTVEWIGEDVETLEDLLRSDLRAVAIGINPRPKSVAAGHYYQGNYGQTFFRRLRKAGLLPDGDGFEDDRAVAAGIGFTDVVKRPTRTENDLRPGELGHGRTILEAKLTEFDVPLVIFVFKRAAETVLGRLPSGFFGIVPRRRARTSPSFHHARTDGCERDRVSRSRSSGGLCAQRCEGASQRRMRITLRIAWDVLLPEVVNKRTRGHRD